MTTLLVLGSKPEPILPESMAYNEVACANASGRSARRHGLPIPRFTVVSAIVTSGRKPANDLAVEALRGLQTGRLIIYPRPRPRGPMVARALKYLSNYRVNPRYVRWKLRRIGYEFGEFVAPSPEFFTSTFETLCEGDPELIRLMRKKQPSTGLATLALGIVAGGYSRFILAGFSFEITHDYARNPLVDERGPVSAHAETDQAILRHLSRRLGTIFTTEPAVHEATGIPYL
jgi:hypothetical protein